MINSSNYWVVASLLLLFIFIVSTSCRTMTVQNKTVQNKTAQDTKETSKNLTATKTDNSLVSEIKLSPISTSFRNDLKKEQLQQ